MKSTDYLKSKGIKFKVIYLEEVPKTAKDVERLYSCPLHQVLKTLVFMGETGPVLVVVQGDKRVDLNKLKQVTKQENLRMATPDEVKEVTGYPVGGVSPLGIEKGIKKIIDKKVFEVETVNIGAGKADVGIELSSEDLKKACDWIIADIIEK